MKLKKLLVLSMLSLMGTSAWAAVPDGVWTMPEPQGLEFTTFTDDGQHYILYNPAAKMFFASGNGWNTMASLRTFGNEIWLQEATEEDAPEGSYELYNDDRNPARGTGEHNMFTDDGNSTWVDHGTQGNYSWSYEIVNDCVRFANVALIADKPAFAGMYLGWDGVFVTADNTAGNADHRDAYTAILRHVDPAAPGASVDFKAVTVDSYEAFVESGDYEAYTEGVKTYIASIGLKEAIEAAEALNIDAAAALAVYTNTGSKAEDMAKAQASLADLIDVKTKLKAAIEEYEGKGYTATDAAKAVLNNPAATKEEVEKAHSDLDAAFVEWGSTQASVANPIDLTSMIVNAHFDNGNCTTGWSGDAFGRGGTVSDGAEHYSKNYDTYQKITGLTPGVYAVGVYGYYRAGNYGGDAENHWLANDEASKYAKLYGKVGDAYYETPIVSPMSGAQAENQGAGDIEVTYTDPETQEDVTVYVPNTMATGDYYIHTLGQYANKLYVAVDESGELTIGVKKTTQIGGDWSFFDDFSLTFYGAGADAYQLMVDETIKNYKDIEIDEGTVYTEKYVTDYRAALAGEHKVNSKEEAEALLAGIVEGYAAIEKNIDLWKKWQAAVDDANQNYVASDLYQDLMAMDDLADYCDAMIGEYLDILDEHALTNEELEAEIAKIDAMIAALKEELKNSVHKDGDDMTAFIENPGFENGIQRATDPNGTSGDYGTATGWTADKYANGNFTPGPLGTNFDAVMTEVLGAPNHCFEAWHCHKFDLWQEISGLPKGMYELNVQGYVRCEVGGYTRGNDLTDYPSPVFLYMNQAKAQFPNVYSESLEELGYSLTNVEDWTVETVNDLQYPNSMGGAAQCFSWGMYKMKAYGLIAKKGDTFRIGVKMDADQDWWCIFDNFKLTYREPTVEVVKPILEEELAKIDLSQPMGSNVFEEASKVKAEGEAALASNNGEQMFDALVNVYKLGESIDSSVALFEKLNSANEALQTKLMDSKADDATKNDARDLASKVTNGIEGHTIADAEVEDLMNQIAVLSTRLSLPAGYANASDENPVDVTSVIQTPDYGDEIGENSIAGWTKEKGGKFGESDYLWVMAYESWQEEFSQYQDFAGLPEGTYEVIVNGFCRNGGAQEDYDGFVADPNNSLAYVYAKNGEGTMFSVPMAAYSKGAQVEDPGISGEIEFTPTGSEEVFFVPNDLASAKDFFSITDAYQNKVVAKVAANGKLRIGVMKETAPTNSWVVLDDWQMIYYGKDSSKTPSGDPTAIKDANLLDAAKVEFFSLNGARISKPGKGVAIMKQTFSDGSVKIMKVTVK